MMHKLVMATALALGTAVALPSLAQQAAAEAPAAAQNPAQILQSVSDQLAKDISGRQSQLAHDHAKLIAIINQVLKPHFDVDYAAILVLGQHAREASPEQRQRFANAFYNSLTQRYADGLLSYSRDKVKVLPYRDDGNSRRALARAQMALDNGKTADIDFAFHKAADGQWQAYDVIVEGISYITNYRNQVDAQIRKSGLDALIQQLENNGGQALQAMDKSAKAKGGGK